MDKWIWNRSTLVSLLSVFGLLALQGCSFLFVRAPDRPAPSFEEAGAAEVTKTNCTSSVAGPVLDGVGSGLSLLVATGTAGLSYAELAPSGRSTSTAFYSSLAVTSAVAAAVGVQKAQKCRSYEKAVAAVRKRQNRVSPQLEEFPDCKAELPNLAKAEMCIARKRRKGEGDDKDEE
jgi:hypothetical protein